MGNVRKLSEAMSDEAVSKATGKSSTEWQTILDEFDVAKKGHAAAARFLAESHGQDPWWSQSITVQYEQERGLRAPGQRSDGSFTINVSKTIAAPWRAAWDAWSTKEGWNAWFTTGAEIDFRQGGEYRNNDMDVGAFTKLLIRPTPTSVGEVARIEFTWNNAEHCPNTKVIVEFVEKSIDKCVVQITHEKLATEAHCAEMKTGWTWALASLKSLLETGKNIPYAEWEASLKS